VSYNVDGVVSSTDDDKVELSVDKPMNNDWLACGKPDALAWQSRYQIGRGTVACASAYGGKQTEGGNSRPWRQHRSFSVRVYADFVSLLTA
jgi:hypothetical protein